MSLASLLSKEEWKKGLLIPLKEWWNPSRQSKLSTGAVPELEIRLGKWESKTKTWEQGVHHYAWEDLSTKLPGKKVRTEFSDQSWSGGIRVRRDENNHTQIVRKKRHASAIVSLENVPEWYDMKIAYSEETLLMDLPKDAVALNEPQHKIRYSWSGSGWRYDWTMTETPYEVEIEVETVPDQDSPTHLVWRALDWQAQALGMGKTPPKFHVEPGKA